jgi:hypothetical protein
MKTRVGLVFMSILVFVVAGFLLSQSQASYTIIGYTQDEKSMTVEYDRPIYFTKYVRLSEVPKSLDLQSLKNQATLAIVVGNSISLPLEGEPTQGEYSVILFAGDNYVEFIRQSADWLKESYNYTRIGGYTILGRRSISTAKGTIGWSGPLTLVGKPQEIQVKPVNLTEFKEINLATGLLRTLWSQSLQQGPTSLSYSEFLQNSFEEKMQLVQTGKFAVMCSGFRDLFVHASTAIPDLNVRIVDAVDYSPQIKDLITYGHSTAEIWVAQLNNWVLFDPWLGIIVTDNGVPIGAEELSKSNSIETGTVAVFPVIDSVPRMYSTNSGEIVFNTFLPSSVKLNQFSCVKMGCSPGYVQYFKNYNVREFAIKER